MNVNIKISPSKLQILTPLPKDLFSDLRKELTYTVKNYQMTSAYINYGWDGKKTVIFKNQTSFPGCYIRIKKFLEKLGHTVNVQFENDYVPTGSGQINGLVLDDFQLAATKAAIKFKYGIIKAPVRAGKTAIISNIIKQVNHFPVWVITRGKDLVLQTVSELEKHLQMPIGLFSESKYIPNENIIVSSYQAFTSAFSASRSNKSESIKQRNLEIAESVKKTKVLILDECHHALSKKCKDALDNFTHIGYKIGTSGTPKSDSVNKLEMESAIGPIIFQIKFEKLIKSGRIVQPYIVMYNLPYAWFSNNLSDYADIYRSNITENYFRNKFIAEIVDKLHEQGKTTFVMIGKLDHGTALKSLIRGSVFVHGTISSDIRKQVYEALQNKTLRCIIGTVGKEGLNLPKLDAVINAESMSSSVLTIQKMRSLTACEGKAYGLVIDFMDKGRYLKEHSEIRVKQYSTLGGFKISTKSVSKNHFPIEQSRWD